jgi:mycothiol system anti-sigma-R factor
MDEWPESTESSASVKAGSCGNNCSDALERLWEYLDAELEAPDSEVIRAHLAECQGCLEEYDVEVVVKNLVRRGCQETAPDALRVRIHEQLTVMRVTATLE